MKKEHTFCKACSFVLIQFSLLSLLALLAENKVGSDTEDESASDGGDCDLTEGEGQTADTCYKDDRDNKEISVVLKVNLLDHLQTADCDEAVESYAHAAHDA